MAINIPSTTLEDLRRAGLSVPLNAPDYAVVLHFAEESPEIEPHPAMLSRPATYRLRLEWQESVPFQGNPLDYWPAEPPVFDILTRRKSWILEEKDVAAIK